MAGKEQKTDGRLYKRSNLDRHVHGFMVKHKFFPGRWENNMRVCNVLGELSTLVILPTDLLQFMMAHDLAGYVRKSMTPYLTDVECQDPNSIAELHGTALISLVNNNILSTKKNGEDATVVAGGRIVNVALAFIAGLDLPAVKTRMYISLSQNSKKDAKERVLHNQHIFIRTKMATKDVFSFSKRYPGILSFTMRTKLADGGRHISALVKLPKEKRVMLCCNGHLSLLKKEDLESGTNERLISLPNVTVVGSEILYVCGSKTLPTWKPPTSPFPVVEEIGRNRRLSEDATQGDGEGDEGEQGDPAAVTRHGSNIIERAENTVVIIYGETKWKGSVWAGTITCTTRKKCRNKSALDRSASDSEIIDFASKWHQGCRVATTTGRPPRG